MNVADSLFDSFENQLPIKVSVMAAALASALPPGISGTHPPPGCAAAGVEPRRSGWSRPWKRMGDGFAPLDWALVSAEAERQLQPAEHSA